jgi:hypothetical protein
MWRVTLAALTETWNKQYQPSLTCTEAVCTVFGAHDDNTVTSSTGPCHWWNASNGVWWGFHSQKDRDSENSGEEIDAKMRIEDEAVGSLRMCVKFRGREDESSRCVFWTVMNLTRTEVTIELVCTEQPKKQWSWILNKYDEVKKNARMALCGNGLNILFRWNQETCAPLYQMRWKKEGNYRYV